MMIKQRRGPTRRRTVLLVPFGVVVGTIWVASAAWACGALVGQIWLEGSEAAPRIEAYYTGEGSHTQLPGNGLAARSCLINPAVGGPLDCETTNPDPDWNGIQAWVDVETDIWDPAPAGGTTYQLPDSDVPYTYCTEPDSQPEDQFGRCLAGDVGAPPPVGVQNERGMYWLNLVQGQWVDTSGNGLFDSNERVSGQVASGCGNGGDQTTRVVHLALVDIEAGKIEGAIANANDPDRAYVDDPSQPLDPYPLGGDKWRFYLPTTNLTPDDPTASPIVANSICIVDRYGTNSIEAPLHLVTL